jgi:putative endonuclease
MTKTLNHLELGSLGERLCAAYLEAEGYQIEARNWRGQSGELDLIATQGEQLVIIEVRTRVGSWLERPAEAVTPSKQRQVARCADEYIRKRPKAAPRYEVIRFDVIGLKVQPPWDLTTATIDHEEGAFCSPWAF